MAKYTVELRELLKDPQTKAAIDKALSTYPMYEPKSTNPDVLALCPTRERLNKKILDHYKYREIGFETVGRFCDELEIAMNEIMPYYNQLFKSVEIMALIKDPFGNVDVTETYKETHANTSKTNDSSQNSNTTTDSRTASNKDTSATKTLDSETPKDNIEVAALNIDQITHADNASWAKTENNGSSVSGGTSTNSGNSSSESNAQNTGTVEHTFTKKGNQGVNTYAHDMNELRTSYLNVELTVVEDIHIKQCFMLCY